jgi:SAM-dependent methyltransferase
MSDFENYTLTSRSYDTTRSAYGVEVILGCLSAAKPAHETVLLDAGCGSGNYTAALSPYVSEVVGVDLNPGMLEVAGRKLAAEVEGGRVTLRQGNLAQLPLEEGSVDAVMINQVLHHLPDRAPGDWPARRQVFGELARVLRPGGSLVLNVCLPIQIRHGYWFFALIPAMAERLIERHPEYEIYQELLDGAGFAVHGRIVPVDVVIQGEHYFDTHGPENATWREGDSSWSLATEPELQAALKHLEELHEAGEADAYVRRHDLRRAEVGQITFIHATRR